MANRIRTRTRKVKIEGESDMMDLDEEERSILEQEKADKELVQSSTFRGVSFDRWFHIILKVRQEVKLLLDLLTYIFKISSVIY